MALLSIQPRTFNAALLDRPGLSPSPNLIDTGLRTRVHFGTLSIGGTDACFTPDEPEPEQIINACMKNKGGALRIVADPADCTARETPITLLGP